MIKKTQWVGSFSFLEWWYNTSFHTSSKMSSFMVLYGYHPQSITSTLKGNEKVQEEKDHIRRHQSHTHLSERDFEVGDWVFLRRQPYKHMSLKHQKKETKLAPKYYGPYKVLLRIGSMDYKLELQRSSHVHLVFHVPFLKKVINNKIPIQIILP
jgi:hypothetical protein